MWGVGGLKGGTRNLGGGTQRWDPKVGCGDTKVGAEIRGWGDTEVGGGGGPEGGTRNLGVRRHKGEGWVGPKVGPKSGVWGDSKVGPEIGVLGTQRWGDPKVGPKSGAWGTQGWDQKLGCGDTKVGGPKGGV